MDRRLAVLGVLATSLALTLVTAFPAGAVQPQPFSFAFDDFFTDTEDCGFPLDVHFVGTITGLQFFDQEGNLVRVQATGEDVGTVTNPANGNTASGVDHWLEVFDVESGEFAILGLFTRFNVPGAGVVLIDAGHIRFDADGNIAHLGGPHQTVEEDFAALCAALA